MKLPTGFLVALTALGFSALGARAADTIVSLEIENDLLFGTDQNFTNGFRLGLTFPEDKEWNWVSDVLQIIPPFNKDAEKRRVMIAIGQSMFTPDDTDTADLILDDRPYAGWLYLALGAAVQKGRRLDIIEIEAGVVGPASLAGKAQRWWHGVIGVEEPQGWRNQLRNEPGFVGYFQRSWKFLAKDDPVWRHVDFTPHFGVAAGNVFTYGAVGATLRIGSDLTRDFDTPPRIKPSLPGSGLFEGGKGFNWYLFAGGNARGVGRNIFLDGNTFRDSHSVSKRHLVADFQWGLVMMVSGVRLAFTHVIRSDEFHGQKGGNRFGAVSLSARF